LRGVRVRVGLGVEEVGLGVEEVEPGLGIVLAVPPGVTGTGMRKVSVITTVGPATMLGGNVTVTESPGMDDPLGLGVGL
jgi:hypothetical protein